MTIKQHAEAAASEYTKHLLLDDDRCETCIAIIAKHMQAAIDEATAASLDLLQKTMTESDAKDRTIERQALRIAELEGLGPLIDLYGSSSWNDGYTAAEGQRRTNTKNETKAKIDAILKGES